LPVIFLPNLKPWMDTISPLVFPAAVWGVILAAGIDAMRLVLNPYRLLMNPGEQQSARRFAAEALRRTPGLQRPLGRTALDKDVEHLTERAMETTEDTE